MDCLTALKEHLILFWCLTDGRNVSDAKFVRCYLEQFWDGAAVKIPEKIKSVGFVFGARLCHERKVSATTCNFSLRKRDDPSKPEMYYFAFDC
jgi:hypothetical protein